jgi:hypothetical protein
MVIDVNRFSVRPADCPPKFNTEDDVSTATPKTGTVPIDLDDKMKEITIHFDFQLKTSKAAKKVAVVHTHLLSKMKEAFANNIVMFKNKGNLVKIINPINWNPIMHQSHFNLHLSQGSKNCKKKYTTVSSTAFAPPNCYLPFTTTTQLIVSSSSILVS